MIHMLGEHGTAAGNSYHVQRMRQCMKQENPDAYVLGEHFFEASQWLQGDQEDGAMNYYGFAHPVRAFLANQDIAYHPVRISAEEFDQWLKQARSSIPFANQLAQFNLLDSHDTARFLSLVGGDVALMRTAVTLLFTYIGTPVSTTVTRWAWREDGIRIAVAASRGIAPSGITCCTTTTAA